MPATEGKRTFISTCHQRCMLINGYPNFGKKERKKENMYTRNYPK